MAKRHKISAHMGKAKHHKKGRARKGHSKKTVTKA